jgi:acyl-CoA thioester hydrolase
MNQGPDTGDLYQVGVTFRVEFADTDTQGRVYYANYFRYFDRARFAYWEAIGCDEAGVRRCEDETVLVDVGAAYKAPARFWEQVSVRCRVARLGRSSLHTLYQVSAGPDGRLLVEGQETLVWFDPPTNRPVPIPEDIRRRIEAFEGSRLAGC